MGIIEGGRNKAASVGNVPGPCCQGVSLHRKIATRINNSKESKLRQCWEETIGFDETKNILTEENISD